MDTKEAMQRTVDALLIALLIGLYLLVFLLAGGA